MADQKIQEFRARAESAIAPADPDLLLHRGRALRRRRQLAPVAALAAVAALGIAVLAPEGGGPRTDNPPAAGTPTGTTTGTAPKQVLGDWDSPLPPGEYEIHFSSFTPASRPDATVEVIGESWEGWDSGAHWSTPQGTVSWGLRPYDTVTIHPCQPDQHATSQLDAVRQLSRIPGEVTAFPRPATAMGLTGTHLQLSIPVNVECRTGEPAGATLMAIWEGPKDPTVTVDVWLLEHDDRLLLLTQGVRGNPSPPMLLALERTLRTIRPSTP